jgi:tRNA (cmo5U34)-methyltransferase
MSSPIDRFNLVAGYYDWLVRLVFGKSMREAQAYFLKDVPPGCNVLILGGGTGWILRALLDKQPDCKVWYIEASSEMIKRTKQKIESDQRRVTFIHGTEDSIPDAGFDFVVTNFFLDLFPSAPLRKVIGKRAFTGHRLYFNRKILAKAVAETDVFFFQDNVPNRIKNFAGMARRTQGVGFE